MKRSSIAKFPIFVMLSHKHYITVCGNNREVIVYPDGDYIFYRDKLQDACRKHSCESHAY